MRLPLSRRPARSRLFSPARMTMDSRRGRPGGGSFLGSPTGGGVGSLTASGLRVERNTADTLRRLVMPWQQRAFGYYDSLGEIKYAAQFYSRALSQLELLPGKKNADGEYEQTDDPKAIDNLARMQDPGGGRTNLLAAYGRLMFLAGEALLLVTQNDGVEQWEMLSSDELRIQQGTYVRYKAPSLPAEALRAADDDLDFSESSQALGSDAIVYRLWKRHPRYSYLADATMQGVLDQCEELMLLTQAVRARARSRLAGSGVLFLDDDLSPKPLEPVPDEDAEEDELLVGLIEAATSQIVNEGSASQVVPIILRVPVPSGKKLADMVYHLQIVDPVQLYPETGLRRECIERIALGLDMPPEILLGLQDSNHWCVDDQTEILTGTGWKRHGGLAEGDEVLTLNHETGMSEWQPVDQVARFEVDDLPMLSIESRFHSSLTTMNHRWPVMQLAGRAGRWERGWTHSDELKTTHRLVTAAPSRNALTPQWVQHDDALVELVAWLWTEGQIRQRPGRVAPQVAIFQSHTANPDNVLRIRAALTSLYGAAVTAPMRGGRGSAIDMTPRWREIPLRDGKTVFRLSAGAAERLLQHVGPDRVVSSDFIRTLTASQLALFIDTSTRADGSTMRSGCQLVGQSDPSRLAPLELAAILLGRSPSSYTQTHEGFHEHEQHYVSISDRQTVRLKKKHIGEARYTGTIWCPVTENSTWLARRNGKVFFTGNTSWQIDEQTWKSHLQPIAQQLVDDLTSSFFRPTLRDAGVADWQDYAILFDASKIINHPDRAKDAKDLYDKRAIGKTALREASGFDEADAPTPDELNEILGVQLRDSSLAVYGIPSLRQGSELEADAGEVTAPGLPGTTTDTPAPAQSGGADVEAGPPAGGPPEANAGAGPSGTAANGNGLRAARVVGAAQLALLRCREAAGNRILSAAKKHPEARQALQGKPTSRTAFLLGPDDVRRFTGMTETQLVGGTGPLIEDALRLFGIHDERVVARVVAAVEQHAARTLYEENPPPLPNTIERWAHAAA